MTENINNLSFYEDALSHLHSKSILENNTNNDVSVYEVCIENNDPYEDSQVKTINSTNFQIGKYKNLKIQAEEKEDYLIPAQNKDEDSFCNDKKFGNFLEKNHSNGYNSNLSRNIINKVTTKIRMEVNSILIFISIKNKLILYLNYSFFK